MTGLRMRRTSEPKGARAQTGKSNSAASEWISMRRLARSVQDSARTSGPALRILRAESSTSESQSASVQCN